MGMTLLHMDHEWHGSAGTWRFGALRAFRRLRAALRLMHRSIIAAKTQQAGSEAVFDDVGEDVLVRDGTKYAQRPLVLGDKWDF
jgi:hypothetical protein